MFWYGMHGILDGLGIIGHPVDQDTYADLNQRWLKKYCSNVKAQTGEWIHYSYRWHAFTYGFETALIGKEAWQLYRAKDLSAYLILFESHGYIFDCYGTACPDLRELHDDVYLFPHDMSWTMIFTHEDLIGIGPFFVFGDDS